MFIGIDPGLTGALAVLDDEGAYMHVYDTPYIWRLRERPRKARVRLPDCVTMASLILRLVNAAQGATQLRVTIETQWARPGQSAAATFITGGGYWGWLGVLAAFGVEAMDVSPQAWKREYVLLGKEKDASRGAAMGYFPTAPLSLKKHHNRADALLLAHYGWQMRGT